MTDDGATFACLRAAGTGACTLDIAVTPNAKRTAADGLHGDALRVRLAAPPVDGKANAALVEWLADQLDLPRRAVTLLRGETARRKVVRVDRAEAEVRSWLKRVLDRD